MENMNKQSEDAMEDKSKNIKNLSKNPNEIILKFLTNMEGRKFQHIFKKFFLKFIKNFRKKRKKYQKLIFGFFKIRQ